MMTLGSYRTSGCLPHDLDKSSTFSMIDPEGTFIIQEKGKKRSASEWDTWTFKPYIQQFR